MPVVQAADADLFYEVSGSGPRLLFVNGSGSSLGDSQLLTGAFVSRFELLAYDYRGLGRSGEVVHGYTMADCATDAAAVMDAAGWQRSAVVGISFGGMVALELAVTHPDRFERLALLCTSAGGAGGSSFPLHELEDLDPEARKIRRRTLMDSRFDEAWLDSHPRDRALVAAMETRAGEPDHPRALGIHEQLQARKGHDTWGRLGSIDCPTFIGCGRYDGIAPEANSRAMASRIAGADLHVYEGGHAFLAQDPAAFDDLFGFLQPDVD
jgi:pimeloyl-ACP methyl ester carboxylesterase